MTFTYVKRSVEYVTEKYNISKHSLRVVKHQPLGSLSNHNERADDDVKCARRDWDENVAFGGKMKLKQRGCSRTTTKEIR